MCDIDKAIDVVQHGETMERGCPDCEERRWAYKLAIDALKEKQARENPKPLTLEQLKAREGKPVWVVDKFETDEFGNGRWVLPTVNLNYLFDYNEDFEFWYADYNKTWQAFDHEPREV